MNGRCHLPERQRLPNSSRFPISYQHARHDKNNGKELQSISKQLTRECRSKKRKEALPFSNSKNRLEKKPVLGIGVECLLHSFDSSINSCTSDTPPGSTWTTSCFSSQFQLLKYSSHWQSSFSDFLEHPSLGRSWNLEALSNGMDGPSIPHR